MTRQNHNNQLLGRNTPQWKRASRIARQHQPWCSHCGTSSDLTGDYDGNHAHARWQDITVLCRTCHSRKDGGRPPRNRRVFLGGPPIYHAASVATPPKRVRSRVW